MQSAPATLELNRDEISVLLDVLEVDDIVGFQRPSVEALGPYEAATQLNGGIHSLRSRGLLRERTPEDDQPLDSPFVFDRDMLSLLLQAAGPDKAILFTKSDPDGDTELTQFAYEATSTSWVEQRLAAPGIAQFTRLNGTAGIVGYINEQLAAIGQTPAPSEMTPTLRIPGEALAAWLNSDPTAPNRTAAAPLTAADCDEAVAGELTADLREYPALYCTYGWSLRSDAPQGGTISMLLGSANGVWLFQDLRRPDGMVTVEKVDGAVAVDALRTVVRHALEK